MMSWCIAHLAGQLGTPSCTGERYYFQIDGSGGMEHLVKTLHSLADLHALSESE